MARELAGRFQRWFEYERDAHAKVLRSLESVPPGRRSGEMARGLAESPEDYWHTRALLPWN